MSETKIKVRLKDKESSYTRSDFLKYVQQDRFPQKSEAFNDEIEEWEQINVFTEHLNIEEDDDDMKTDIYTKAIFTIIAICLVAIVAKDYALTKGFSGDSHHAHDDTSEHHGDSSHDHGGSHDDSHASNHTDHHSSHGSDHSGSHKTDDHGDSHDKHPSSHSSEHKKTKKPTPDEVLTILKQGNTRFISGNSTFPHITKERIALAGKANQADYAYATVITCSDSRVPVELVFDSGVMDLFVIRVAGNVCDTDAIGSIEYGLAHVHTPLLVVLGHTQCGAVTAVTHGVQGHAHKLERNIPPLVDNIEPAVHQAIKKHPHVQGDAIIPHAIQENVWQSIYDLFHKSPVTRTLARLETVKVVGAIYDVGTGKVTFLDLDEPLRILDRVEHSDDKETQVYYTKRGH